MKPPDVALRGLVLQWLDKAAADFDAAEQLCAQGGRFREIVAFHCQQAVEKYLKAFLVSRQIEFPKTHDLEELLELLAPVRPDVAAMLEGIEMLSPFGVKIRYPGDFPELLPGQEQIAFNLANRTREAIMTQLQQHLTRG
jgi:HEPN domain-containing protein